MLRQTDCDDADQNVLDVKELPSGPIISYYVLSNHLNGFIKLLGKIEAGLSQDLN